MIAKVIYFNWRKAEKEDLACQCDSMTRLSLKRVTWTGELLSDRPDLYDNVGEIGVPDSSENSCELAFRAFNRVLDGDMSGMTIRSMSVGDLVVFDDSKLFVCYGSGWNAVSGHSLAFWALPLVKEQ